MDKKFVPFKWLFIRLILIALGFVSFFIYPKGTIGIILAAILFFIAVLIFNFFWWKDISKIDFTKNLKNQTKGIMLLIIAVLFYLGVFKHYNRSVQAIGGTFILGLAIYFFISKK
jgi:hypothetical protein